MPTLYAVCHTPRWLKSSDQVLSEKAVLIDMETSPATCYPQHVHIHRAWRVATLIR